jgi:hypothetical protein
MKRSQPRRRVGRRRRRTLKVGALFCGIGGLCFGFKEAGFETSWANDADPYACEVYRRNFPKHRLIEKDVRKLSVAKDKLKPVDILHAGFPCQSFSQAGGKAGFDDDRGKLFFEIIRLVKEFKGGKPAVIVLENAPFLTMGEGGKEGEEGGAGGQQRGGGSGGNGAGGGSGTGSGGKGKSSAKAVELLNVRSVVLSPKNRRLAFTPTVTGKIEVLVYEAGADTDRQLTVTRSTFGKVRKGVMQMPARQGVRTTLELGLDSDFLGAMKVAAHAI